MTFPASAFTSGFDTITAPANFVDLTVPTSATTYNNTAQLFVSGIGTGTQPTCGPGTTTTASTFESSDPLNLAGDSITDKDYCQWAASLTVPPTGGPGFTLLKTVQGDLDSGPKYPPGIGDASPAGTGNYTLQWSDTGGKGPAHSAGHAGPDRRLSREIAARRLSPGRRRSLGGSGDRDDVCDVHRIKQPEPDQLPRLAGLREQCVALRALREEMSRVRRETQAAGLAAAGVRGGHRRPPLCSSGVRIAR